MIRFLGAVPVPIPLVEGRGFSFDLNTLRDRLSDKTRLVVLNSPANPTGGVMPRDDLVQMAGMLRDRDLVVLSDEIYSRIWYECEPCSIASVDGMLENVGARVLIDLGEFFRRQRHVLESRDVVVELLHAACTDHQ